MKTAAIVLSFFAVFVAALMILGFSYISAYNAGNRMEQSIIASYENNRNILAQYGLAIAEAAQIPDMQRDDLTAVVTAALEARYGEDGSGAIFQFIQEQNPQIDSSVYTELQRLIASGRTEFREGQRELLDRKRVYETALGSFWQGTWMGIAGYPKIDLTEYDIVSSEASDRAFETKTDTPIKLR